MVNAMSLTSTEKQRYSQLIQNLWNGSVSSSTSQISEDVADIVDTVIDEIHNCSDAFAGTLAFIAAIGGTWLLPRKIIKDYYNALNDWISDVEGSITYQACINQATLNWKSALALALMGL